MHRIDGAGATVGNLFTEGNPALGIPATVVTDDWANDVQEELCNLVEDQGITLVKGTQTQVLDAIKSMIGFGGNEFNQVINNNQAALNLTGIVFDKATIKAVQLDFEIYRQTDTQNVMESGTLFLSHRTATDTWELSQSTQFDDSGVTLSVVAGTGQVQYASDNLTGTSYAGRIRITALRKFKQTLV